VQHWSRRALSDTNRTLWAMGVLHPSLRFFFRGDTGYSRDFGEIRARSAHSILPPFHRTFEPRWFMGLQHVDPRRR